ncbi:MAG: aminoacetone oxidase family FAD-binding enzyme [Terrimonas sp.]|nr:aminoacetone oxidase family FAD-binding enzyme [Terrimonas sp.]
MKDNLKSGKTLIVIGGGAAGIFCAVNAARLCPSLQVVILEKSSKLLSKVKISGGGRCNVTHACFDIPEMSEHYPRGKFFVRKTFHRFFTTDTVHWFEERGVQLKTEKDGRMFPVTDNSQTIIDCLMKEVNQYGISIRMNAEVRGLFKNQEHFVVDISGDREMNADFVCIACGGYPKATLFEWILKTGHHIENPVPSLFTFNMPGNPLTKLMGIAVAAARIKIRKTKLEETGPLLITHWGLSGPVVLRLSAWGARELAATNWHFQVAVNWLPELNEQELRDRIRQVRFELAANKMINKNPFGLPARLWEYMLQQSGIGKDLRWSDLPAKDQNRLVGIITAAEFEIKGKTTFREEFVTAGGIRLNEVDAGTMMSKKIPGLYFAGEVLDVDGITGGYNFQHAWTSGFIAAESIAAGADPSSPV